MYTSKRRTDPSTETTISTGPAATRVQVQLSVIIPIHNEEKRISIFLERIEEILDATLQSYEVLIINDGSCDNTWEILREEEKLNSHVRVISFVQNCGKGHAVKTGVLQSLGKMIIFVDGDLDISASTIKDYISELENCDLVIASKRHPLSNVKAPFSRKFLSRGFNLLVRALIGIKIKDTQAGLKAGKGVALQTIFGAMVVRRYAFDVELLAIATALNLKIKEMPIDINIRDRFQIRDIARMILDVAVIWYRHRIKRSYPKKGK
jgi:glycosyltransferase involved in cell wall biosynthesis